MRFLRWVAKVFNECNTSRAGRYEYLRVGATTGLIGLVILEVSSLIWHFKFDSLAFSSSYSMILTGSGVAVGLKNKLES